MNIQTATKGSAIMDQLTNTPLSRKKFNNFNSSHFYALSKATEINLHTDCLFINVLG